MHELLHRISQRELAEWMVYFSIEPFGVVRDNMHAAMIAAVIAEAHRNPDKRSEPFTLAEFMLGKLSGRKRKRKKTPDEIVAAFRAWARAAQPTPAVQNA